MSIQFLCAHCKNVVKVKDEAAGKKGKCPHCQKIITVPTPAARPSSAAVKPADGQAAPAPAPPPKQSIQTTAPPPAPTDLEAEAAAALADEPKPGDAAAPTTIDFACPMCDAQLHMPLSEAGKRNQCPECKRIIKVPEPAKRDPANWRQTAPNLPSGAKREEVAAPEGVWGSAAAATVSRESLHEAGAVPQKKEAIPLSRRIVRYAVWSVGAVVVLACLVLGYLKWRDSRAEQGVETAVAYADNDPGKTALGGGGRAAMYHLAGEYYLRAAQPDSGKRAHDLFEKGLAAARQAPEPEHDALLYDLAVAEVELGGKPQDVDAGRKISWVDVSKDLSAMLGAMKDSQPKLEALRAVARRLAANGEGKYAMGELAHGNFPQARDLAEALGQVGLELAAAGQKDQATTLMAEVMQLYKPAGKDKPPPLAPAAAALAFVMNQALPEPAKPSADDVANAVVGQVEGLARQAKLDEARNKLREIPKDRTDAVLRAEVALAAADLDDKASANKDVDAALKDAPGLAGGPAAPWLLLRLLQIGVQAKTSADTMQPIAALIADPQLRGRAQLTVLKARLADPKQAGDPKLMDAVEAKTVSAWLARAEWARRNSGSTGAVKGWDGTDRAFGLVGLALGEQGGD